MSEGAALGILMCGRERVPSGVGLSFAFEGAWRRWNDPNRFQFRQVSTDIAKGLNGYIALTHADGGKQSHHLYWELEGADYVVRAFRPWPDGVVPEEVAASIEGDVAPDGWMSLASELLRRVDDWNPAQ